VKTDLINAKASEPVILGYYEGEALDTNITNLNGMDITREVIENVLASDEYERGIQNRWFCAMLGHPKDPLSQELANTAAVLTDMWIKDNGKVYAKLDLLNTPVGRIVKTMQDAGVVFGISIRGAGDVVGGVVDPDTFMFRGFDLVAFPAYPDSVPTFTAVAASTDPEKRKQYQRICAAVEADIDNITSCEAIDVLQSQFAPNSKEYKALDNRKKMIKSAQTLNIDKQKLEAMTDMYLDSQAIVASQAKEIDKLKADIHSTKYASKRKVSAVERITTSQMWDIPVSLDQVTASRDMFKNRTISLSKKLEAAEKSNLIYKQKIESAENQHSKALERKDSIIASLKSDMRKTVTASKDSSRAASDLDVENTKLRKELDRVTASLLDYQEAYANIYAHALGVTIDNMQVSATTTVEELQEMVAGATNTANIPSTTTIDDMYIADDDNDLITL
jgi:hypothetical protein